GRGGETVGLGLVRAGETRTVKARIGEIEKALQAGGQAVQELAGASFREVSKSGLPGRNRAVLVTEVKPETPAYRHGVRSGDLIIGVNGRRVTSISDLTKSLKTRESVQLNVLRGDNMLTIPMS